MGELDDLLAAEQASKRTITLVITNPTAREERRIRQIAVTVNSNKSYGIKRAKVTDGR